MAKNKTDHEFLSDAIHDHLRVAEERRSARNLIAQGANDDLGEDEEPFVDEGDPNIDVILVNGLTLSGVVDQVGADFVDLVEGENVPAATGDEAARPVLTLAAPSVAGVRVKRRIY